MVWQPLGLLEGCCLRQPINLSESDVEVANDYPWAHNAGAKEDGEIDFVGQLAPGGQADAFVVPLHQLDHDEHWESEQQRYQPDDNSNGLSVALGPLHRVKGLQHSKVALCAHDCKGEDAGVHGEEVQTEQDATANVPKVPFLDEVGPNNEGDGEKVEEVCQSEVDDVNIHGGR